MGNEYVVEVGDHFGKLPFIYNYGRDMERH